MVLLLKRRLCITQPLYSIGHAWYSEPMGVMDA